MRDFRWMFLIVAVAGVLCVFGTPVCAVIMTWDTSSGSLINGNNWDPTGPPGSRDTGNIFNGGTAVINSGDTIHVGTLNVGCRPNGNVSGHITQNAAPWESFIGFLSIGSGSGGTGSYTQSAGVATIQQSLSIWSTGTLNQSAGSIHFSGADSSDCVVTISGTYNLSGGSLRMFNSRRQKIGSETSGKGRFNQTGGTNVAAYVKIGRSSNQAGKYEISGGSLHSSGLYVGYASTGSFIQTAGTVHATGMTVGNSNGTKGVVQILAGQIDGTNLTVAYATGSTGTLAISKDADIALGGDITFCYGMPRFEIEMASLEDFTQLTADSADLGANATLDVDCGTFRPIRYDEFLIVSTASGATGAFAAIDSNIVNGLHDDPPFIDSTSEEGVSIIFDGYTGGDADGNDAVDLTDLGKLGANWNKYGMDWEDADFDGDGHVYLVDLGILSANWGWTGSSGKQMGESLPELKDVDGDGDFDIDDVNLILEKYGKDQ